MNRLRAPVARLGLIALSLGLASALLSVVFALPPFRIGIWFQSEPVVAAYNGAAGVAAVGLLLLLCTRPRCVGPIVRHPFVLLPAVLGLWSLAVSPLATAPMLSVLGTPELGQGALWYLDLAVLVGSAMVLFRYRLWRRVLPWLALAVGMTSAILSAIADGVDRAGGEWQWAPYYFTDYTAFYGVFLVPVLFTWLRPEGRGPRFACVAAGAVILLLSRNWSAVVLSAVVLAASVLVLPRLSVGESLKRWAAAGAILSVPIGVMAAASVFALGLGYLGEGSSSWSRHLLNRLALEFPIGDAAAWLGGTGWGHFTDYLIANATLEGVKLFGGYVQGPNWDALAFSYFHSHNVLVEALVSVGLVGVALAWVFPAAIPLFAKRSEWIVAACLGVVLAGLETVWFQFCVTVPVLAMALAGIAAPVGRGGRRSAVGVVAASVLTGTLVLQVWAVSAIVSDGLLARRMVQYDLGLSPSDPLAGEDCRRALDDHGRGGVHLAWLLRNQAVQIAGRLGDEKPIETRHVERLRFYVCAAEHYASRSASLRLLVVGLIVRSELAFTTRHPSLDSLTRSYLRSWGPRLTEVLERAPKRTDLAIPYLAWLTREEREAEVLRYADRLLRTDPDDPVGLWYSGSVLMADSGRARQGLSRLNRSLDRGIERFMPVDGALKEMIRAESAP